MIEYKEDTFRDNIVELLPMFSMHFDDCGHEGGPETVNVDIDHYMHLEEQGYLKCFSVKKQGKLIGYMSGTVYDHPHHKDALFYTTDTIFILPEYRKGTIGIHLIKYAEKVMKEQYNVDYFHIDTSVKFSLDKLLTRMGYTNSYVSYVKPLGG